MSYVLVYTKTLEARILEATNMVVSAEELGTELKWKCAFHWTPLSLFKLLTVCFNDHF